MGCRAARNDGWIGDLITTDRAIEAAARLRALRAENGFSLDDFTILTPLTDALTIADYERTEAGITGIQAERLSRELVGSAISSIDMSAWD